MKKHRLLGLLFCALAFFLHAQQPSDNDALIARNFQTYFNEGAADSIFDMYTTEMQHKFPIYTTRGFYAKLNQQAGNLVEMHFQQYEGKRATYLGKFEQSLYTIAILASDGKKINGLSIRPYEPDSFPAPARNTTLLQLPFKGEWTVLWGGDTKEQNRHIDSRAQKNAFDILIKDKYGKSFKTTGRENEDFYAFGKEIIAPCDGEVVEVIDDVPDNTPGTENPDYLTGNTVVIKTANSEYLLFAHLKMHSVKVKMGQRVKQGELLGLCGNSGNSTEPHLHFHIQNIQYMNVATGIKCYFNKLLVNGVLTTNYSPVKGDRIENPGK